MTNKLIISITTEQDAMQQFKTGFMGAVNNGKPQDTHIYFHCCPVKNMVVMLNA